MIDPALQLAGITPKTANELWFDAIVRHQIHVIRYSGGLKNDLIELLNAVEDDIASQIKDSLAKQTAFTPVRLARAQKLIASIHKIRNEAWGNVNDMMKRALNDFSGLEIKWMDGGLKTVVPFQLETTLPSPTVVKSLLASKPFQGKILKDWIKTTQAGDLDRIASQVKIGVVQGESAVQIARRVVGTKALLGSDGVTQLTRRQVEAVTRTATQAYSNGARQIFLEDNSDLFTEERFVATLDSRTTPICRADDGKKYPIGSGPMPPLHFNCRSLRVAVISEDAVGNRPARNYTQKQLVREYAKENGLGDISNRDNLPRGTKAAYDKFERQRMRELTGQVPAKTTYQEWLKGQTSEVQNDILGKTKGELFRKGGLQLDRFVDDAGNELTLSQLATQNRTAFTKAGLNPENFLNN